MAIDEYEYDVDHSKQTRKSWPCKELVDIFPNQQSLGGSALPIVEKHNLNKSCEGVRYLAYYSAYSTTQGSPSKAVVCESKHDCLIGRSRLIYAGL